MFSWIHIFMPIHIFADTSNSILIYLHVITYIYYVHIYTYDHLQAHKNSSGAITLNEFIIVSKKFPNILLPAVGYVPAADAVKA